MLWKYVCECVCAVYRYVHVCAQVHWRQGINAGLLLLPLPPRVFVKIYFYFMRLSILSACKCTVCMHGTCRSQKRALAPWELELKRVLNHKVGAGN